MRNGCTSALDVRVADSLAAEPRDRDARAGCVNRARRRHVRAGRRQGDQEQREAQPAVHSPQYGTVRTWYNRPVRERSGRLSLGRPARLLLSGYLLLWIPVNFAAELASVLPSLGVRGAPAIIEVVLHGGVAALSFAAGMAIWSGSESAFGFASLAVLLSTAVAIQSLFWSSLPSQTKPGDHLPLSIVLAAHGAAWLLYLRRRARASR